MTTSCTVVDDDAVPVEAPPAPRWWRRPVSWTWVGTGLVLVLFAELAWRRRWMSDDGLLVLRTVRQVLAGNGPVFNVGERVEANTSPLWTAILSLLGLIPGVTLEWVSVLTGLVFSLGGLLFGLDGARRLYRPAGFGLLVPAGALVVCALPPFRDFATSGLETGLITWWLGGSWWSLVRRAAAEPGARSWPIALVLGLGPLIRPDLALFSVVAFAALVVLVRPGWRPALGLLAVAGALPLAYQVFRMGYYGLLTPNTALAKEAAAANWARGWAYFADLAGPYQLWTPVALLVLAAVLTLWWVPVGRAFAVLTLLPLAGACLLGLYVIRVGGDFMHGRMLLPALFCALLPVLALPLTRRTAVVLAGVGVWAFVAAGWLRPPYVGLHQATNVTDERDFWSYATGRANPVLASDYAGYPGLPATLAAVRATTGPAVLVKDYRTQTWQAHPTDRPYLTVATDSMGALSLLVPLDVRLHDGYGLASPLAAHSAAIPDGRPGHQKWLPGDWELADSSPVDASSDVRAALACPRLEEIIGSVREPLTFGRFRANLTGSFARGSVRFPRDAEQARFCR
ncbi:hypothetical protein [Amycolatopsis sp. H20-H5]|uniref:hypothetical protein n=1 Tax=Amycolatopsis sp. H20-H5 TaxID=3046309 RepID=UPI002DBCD27B|nr:hypothetical protein [Amycolatopsis sp. H20-H5]MEC3981538.1 hypothetical protein [Amycolatopsis sp. H20-H5]